jgi:hypothetical protein
MSTLAVLLISVNCRHDVIVSRQQPQTRSFSREPSETRCPQLQHMTGDSCLVARDHWGGSSSRKRYMKSEEQAQPFWAKAGGEWLRSLLAGVKWGKWPELLATPVSSFLKCSFSCLSSNQRCYAPVLVPPKIGKAWGTVAGREPAAPIIKPAEKHSVRPNLCRCRVFEH